MPRLTIERRGLAGSDGHGDGIQTGGLELVNHRAADAGSVHHEGRARQGHRQLSDAPGHGRVGCPQGEPFKMADPHLVAGRLDHCQRGRVVGLPNVGADDEH